MTDDLPDHDPLIDRMLYDNELLKNVIYVNIKDDIEKVDRRPIIEFRKVMKEYLHKKTVEQQKEIERKQSEIIELGKEIEDLRRQLKIFEE